MDKLLLLYAGIERFCLTKGDTSTTRFIKKFRIMLQQGNTEVPIANAEGVIGRCRMM